MIAIRTFTRHGIRAHYRLSKKFVTLCDKPAVELSTRSRFWRRHLAQASVCRICDGEQNSVERGL